MNFNFELGEMDSQRLLAIMRKLKALGLVSAEQAIHREMDLIVVHNHDTPLDFARINQILEKGPEHEEWACLLHDLQGITQNLDRSKGKLTSHFSPRLAKPEPPKKPIDYTPRLDKQRRG